MLEIKSYDDWNANQKDTAEPAINLKKYTDYVRSSYYSAGQLNQETEQEITAGVKDRLTNDVFTDDMSEDDKNNLFSSVVGASSNADTDARFVLDHLRTYSDGASTFAADRVKASNLANYLTLREKAPSEAEGFRPYVDEILADKSLVKRARMSAVDRGEYSIAALDEEDGSRSLYAGASARPDSIASEVSSLLATGALSSSDLYRINDFVKPMNGGLTNGAEDSRYETFMRTVSDLAKNDADLNKLIEKNASNKKEADTAALRTTGESILEGAKTVISYPFVKGSELLVDLFDGEQKQPKYASDTTLSDALSSNAAFNLRFSAAEIEKFSDALTTKVAGAPYRADRPETGITTDSMGNVIIDSSLLANVKLFEQAVSTAPLNKDQQKQASVQRKLLLKSAAPDLLQIILEEDSEAVGEYAKAKADGLSPSAFLEQYVGSGKNYDGFSTRLEQFGKSAWKTLADVPLGIAAIAGSEWAAKEMGSMMDDQTRRQEYSRLFGDEYGFGFQLLNTLPQVATDIGLTIGTGGAFAGAKALAKTGAMSARAMIRGGAKMALSEIDDVAAASFRQAASAGGSQFLGKAITDVGKSFGSKFGELAPLAAVTFSRSAGSAFGSIYNQLPEDMSHEEKYKNALPAALAMGISTSVITVGLSGLGLGAVEDIGTNVVRKIRGGDALTARSVLDAAERAVPVSKMNYRQSKRAYQNAFNEGRILSDAAFNTAARAAITSTYKNWLKTTLKGGLSESFEESLDQAVGMAIENSALDRDASLAEKVAQVFDAGLLGGALGAGIAGSTQFGPIRKSEQSLVFEGRASALEDISKRLRKTNSDATADVLQRRIDEAREQARLSIERDVAAQSDSEETQKRTIIADPNERPLRGQPVFDEETGTWSPAIEPFDPLLDDLIGEEIEYIGLTGVLERSSDGSTINLRLSKPYLEGGEPVEFINLGPRFQKASKFVAPFLTTPDGNPYVLVGGSKKKVKFAFPAKEKTTPESFTLGPRDDEGNVRSIIVNGGQSLKEPTVTMPLVVTGSARIKAIAEWYGIDITPKPPVSETPEGQFEFAFANRKETVKSKEEFGFVALTDEERQAETEDILGRSFAPATEGELELVTDKQNRTRRILEGLDAQISSKLKNREKVTATLAPLKDLSDKQLTKDQKLIKEQSTSLNKKLTKEIATLRKAKKDFSEDAILLGSTTPQEPTTAEAQGPRVYRSWDESQKQLDRDFAESLNGIKQSYLDADVPVDVDRIENVVRAVSLRNKLAATIAFSDISIEELDAVESMAQDIIDFASDPVNKATAKQRELILTDYANLIARINTVQEYIVEREYEEVSDLAAAELDALTQEEAEPEEEVETKASDTNTLHYLLSNTPEAFATIDVKPFANKKTLATLKNMGVEIDEQRRDSVETIEVTGYDQETREILYGKLGVTVRAPLSTVNFESPALRTAIDAASTEVFEATQQARKEAAAIRRRTARPLQDRAMDFLNKVNGYVVKSRELNARLEQNKNLPPAKRSAAVQRIQGQMAEMRKEATAHINRVGSILQSDFDFYKELKEEQKQEITAQLRSSLFGVGGFKQEVAPRAKVKAFNPVPDIKVTRVVYAKDQFRKGTQEEDMLNELVEGGFIVNLPDTGKALAQAGLFITESGVSKFPAFSQSQVEAVEVEGQEVADTNPYIKNKHELLAERVLSKYPQLGVLTTITGRSKTMGAIGSVGDTRATLDTMEVEIQRMEQQIARKAFRTGVVPKDFRRQLDVLKEEVAEAAGIKVKLKTKRYYEIDGKKYDVLNSKTDKSIYFPIDDNGFGVFTNNPKITKAQIAEGYRVIIPDTYKRITFNPSQYVSEQNPRIIEGYYKPRNPEPFTVGSFNSELNSRITEDGEQILEGRSTFLNKRVDLFVYKMLYLSEVGGVAGAAYTGALRSLETIAGGLLRGKQQFPERIPKTEQYIDNTISELKLGFAADLNEYRLAQYVAKQVTKSLKLRFRNEGDKELVARLLGDSNNKMKFSDLSEDVRDQLIFDNLNKTNLVKFVTDMVDGDVESIAKDIQSVNKTIKGSDPNSIIIEYARFLFVNATRLGGKFDAIPDPNTYLNRPVSGSERKGSIYNMVANKNARAEQTDPNTGLSSLDYFVDRGKDNRNTTEEIIGPEATDIFQKLQDEIDRRNQELGGGLDPLDMLVTENTSALGASDLTFMNRPALLADELYRTIKQDTSGRLVQVFRDLAIAIGYPQSQVDELPDATLVQALAAKLNSDYILHTNKGYARVVMAELSGSDPDGYFGGLVGSLGRQAAGLLIALNWLPPTIVETKEGRTKSLPLRAPAERVAAIPAAAMGATPEEAIAAGKAMRQEEAKATDDEVINYSRDYLEASKAALPYLLKLGSERRIALNTIEEARLDLFDSFRLLRTLIGQTDPDDMGPARGKTLGQITEGIQIGRAGATPESIVEYQNKTISDIEAEIAKLQDTRTLTQALVDGKVGTLARIEAIREGVVQYDEAGIPTGRTKPLLIATKDPKKKTALRRELKNLDRTYVELNGKGDETLADLDASITTKQKQLEKAKAVGELIGIDSFGSRNVTRPRNTDLINILIERVDKAYKQIAEGRDSLSQLSDAARARVKDESRRMERLLGLKEWEQYVEIITKSPIILKGSRTVSKEVADLIASIQESETARRNFDAIVRERTKALDQVLIKNRVNIPRSNLLTNYTDPVEVVKKNRVEYAEGQTENPNVRKAGRPRTAPVAPFSEENFSPEEREQSTPESFSEAAGQIAGAPETKPDGVDLPTKEVGGKIKVQGRPRNVLDPNYGSLNFSLSQIDPSLRDEARAENLRVVSQLGLVSGDPNSVLGALRRITETGTPRQQLIAELLLTAPDFVRNINFAIVELDLGFAGLYDRTSNSVLVNLNEHNGRGLVDVLLHEYLHAPTAKVLLNPKTASQRKAVARIEVIRNFALANAVKLGLDTDPVVRLGLSSNAEFLTYALTAPEFQNILAGLAPFDQRSILRRLVDAILNVFGLDPKKHEVAADAIQELLDFTKMSLSHSGTFSVDNKWKAMVGTVRSRNERAQAYSDLVSAEIINNVISRYNEGSEDSIFLAEGSGADAQSGKRPLAVSGDVTSIANEIRFQPEERAAWKNLQRAAAKELNVAVDLDMDANFGDPNDDEDLLGLNGESTFDATSYDPNQEYGGQEGRDRSAGNAIPSSARDAWEREVNGILKRSGVNRVELQRRFGKLTREAFDKNPEAKLDYEALIAEPFFGAAGGPLMDWFTERGGDYSIYVEGARPVDRPVDHPFYRAVTHLLVATDRNRLSADPDRRTAVMRMLKGYIEAFAPEQDLEDYRSWFLRFFDSNSTEWGKPMVQTGKLEDPVMTAKQVVDYLQKSQGPDGKKVRYPDGVMYLRNDFNGLGPKTLEQIKKQVISGDMKGAERTATAFFRETPLKLPAEFRDVGFFRMPATPKPDDNTHYIRTAELGGDTAIDVLGEIRRIMPEGINIEINNAMVGAMGTNPTKPNTILVNENLVATMAAGLSAANARAVVRTAVDEELAHLASFSVFKTEDFAAIAAEIGPDRVNEILDMIYSSAVPDDTERAARIAADREAGVTGDIDAAAEWVRMEITRLATGRTREADIAFFYTNPTLLERFLEGLRAFINKLKQQFKSEPTAGTAARISQASRSFRKLRNGGVLPTPEPSAANEYGDSTAFLNAINGDIAEGQEDRTYFMLPVSGTGNSKAAVSGFWKTVQDKMYNLPMELRKFLSMRDGTISQIEYTIQDFDRRFPKMRDAALAGGVSIEDIGMLLGTTAPVVQGEARKEIQRKVREFKTKNAKDPDLERKADDYEAKLTQPEADKFFAAFRKEQKAMETKIKSAGFGDLVNYLVEFRGEINKYKAVINFDESNDVYLTRTFRFFGSEGWASFAKTGGVAMLDGKEVDFNKLRAAAAKHFEWEVNNEAKQTGQTFTAEQHDKKLVWYLDQYLTTLELQAADAKELGAMNTIRKDVNRLLNKKDFDAPLRTLLGEVTDPFENAVRTVYNVGRLAANERFLRNFAKQAIEIEVASRTRKPDMELLFPPSQSAQLGDLAGLYVRKDIAATIREELGMNGMKQQSKATEQINMFGRFISKFSGLSITAKTLGSVGFYPRNVLGGIALTTSQGIVNPVYLKEALRLSVIANMSLNGKIKAESEESRNQIRRLVELQVLKDDTQGRIAMDMLNGFVNSTDQQLEELLNDIVEAQGSGNIEKIIKKFKLKGTWEATKQAGGSTVEFLASLNNVIDSAFKLNAYFYELSVLKEAYGDTETESKLEVDAARKVKLTFPTHSEQFSLAKAFNKSPFSMVALPFVRWKTEVFRTMFNTVPLAFEEIKSGNPTMRSRGVKRLIGFGTTMAGGGTAYGAIFATLFSLLTDDEEDERGGVRKLTDEELDALRQGLPVWQRNHGIFAQMLQDGSIQVIDMSNILPHSQLTDLIGLASRGNAKGIADYFTSEMIGTQIAASTLFELKQNRDDFDQPIWLDTDGALGASFKMLMHLAKGTVVPSIVDKAMKIGRYGEQNAKEMIVGELTGVRPIIHKVTDIEYRGMRNLKESADAVVSLLYPLSSGKALDPNKIEGIMGDHQSASNKNQQHLHNFLMGMKSIGSTEASLAATAQQMKFSKQRFGAALAGKNIPWGANDQWSRKTADNMIRIGEQDPAERIPEINRVAAEKADGYNTNFLQ
jgi:hypothetical protein